MLSYCKKCGRVIHAPLNDFYDKCDVCGSETFEVPREYIDNFRWRDGDGEQALIEECVKTSPEFDQYLFDHKRQILDEQDRVFNAAMARGKAIASGTDKGNKFGVSCPYCKATNVKKISTTSKAVKVGLFGIFGAVDAGKQWHCNHCGSKF